MFQFVSILFQRQGHVLHIEGTIRKVELHPTSPKI